MAANREAYQQSMDAGHEAAWDQDWSSAIKHYTRAAQIAPNDAEAHINLGLSLLHTGRLDDSLKVYTKAHQLAPEDPLPLERSADVLERMGRLKEAAQQYVHVADVYLNMKDLAKSIANWEKATKLTPGLISIHAKLAQAYERIGNKTKALQTYLTLAFNFHRVEDDDKAIKAVERALRIDKRNPTALNMLRALRSGGEVHMPVFEDASKKDAKEADLFSTMSKERENVGDADPLGPMGEAMDAALNILSGYIVESGALDAAGGDALQAMQYQRQELFDDAIAAYQRASAGLNHPSLKLNLGALLVLQDQPDEATKHLGEAVTAPQLSSGALHGLGQAYLKLGKQKQASRYLIQSLQAVDTSLAVGQEEALKLAEIYDRLLGALDGRADDALNAINTRFVDLLSGTDWKRRIPETRRHLQEVIEEQGDQGVVDFLGTGGSDQLAVTVSRIDGYIRQGFLTLAMDEAHRAVENAPYYLPVHVRMAEIMMREGRLRQAINKYNTVARAYMAREENDRAASILEEVLQMAPLDVVVRKSLINLLESEGRMEEVIDQYVDLAKTYNQLGNFDLARETYQQAERLGRRNNAPVEKIAKIKHSLADMEQMRLDTRRAIKTYEEIVDLVPDDMNALKMLVELNYSQGNAVDAIKSLDKLLGLYAQNKMVSKIVQMLEGLVRHYPTDTGLRSRLAQIYKQLDRNEDAIEQLDALGELQLDAGMHDDARKTIRQIVELEPENVEDYRALLGQLGG